MFIETLHLWPLWSSNFLHSGSLSVARQFLFLKIKQGPASLQAEALVLSELIHQSTKMGKDERKISRHKKEKKVRFYASANLKCKKFYKIHTPKKKKKTFKI